MVTTCLSVPHTRWILRNGQTAFSMYPTYLPRFSPIGDYVWRNLRPAENHLLCFPYNAEFESVSPGGFHIYGLSIPWRTIEEKAVALEYPVNAELHFGMECVELPLQSIAYIRWKSSSNG